MNKYSVVISLFVLVLASIPVSMTVAQTNTQAGLVIRFSDNDVQTFCIPFEGDSISGIELLEKSKLKIGIKYSGEGQAVCKIESTGCPIDDSCLLCQRPYYWSYWHLKETNWEYSSLGAGYYEIKNGDVDGWSWGTNNNPPPAYNFEDICKPTSNLKFTATQESIKSDPQKPTKTRKPTFLPATSPLRSPTPTEQPSKTATLIPSQTRLPTTTPIPDVQATSPPTAVFITETSTPPFAEIDKITPTSTPKIVENIPAPELENPVNVISGPPKKAANPPRTAKELYSLESSGNKEKDASSGLSIMDILKIIQNLLTNLLP